MAPYDLLFIHGIIREKYIFVKITRASGCILSFYPCLCCSSRERKKAPEEWLVPGRASVRAASHRWSRPPEQERCCSPGRMRLPGSHTARRPVLAGARSRRSGLLPPTSSAPVAVPSPLAGATAARHAGVQRASARCQRLLQSPDAEDGGTCPLVSWKAFSHRVRIPLDQRQACVTPRCYTPASAAPSIRHATISTSLLIRKLAAYPRRNGSPGH